MHKILATVFQFMSPLLTFLLEEGKQATFTLMANKVRDVMPSFGAIRARLILDRKWKLYSPSVCDGVYLPNRWKQASLNGNNRIWMKKERDSKTKTKKKKKIIEAKKKLPAIIILLTPLSSLSTFLVHVSLYYSIFLLPPSLLVARSRVFLT